MSERRSRDDSDENDPATELLENSVAPVRALVRGLDALRALNRLGGATISEVAKAAKQPRSTAYRTLRTLVHAGYATRDPADERYRPTIKVRQLSDGFEDESWIAKIARPKLAALGEALVWPVTLATLHGSSLLVRETTDEASPLVLHRYTAGYRAPLLDSASGRAYLAFCDDRQRTTLLELLGHSSDPQDQLARRPQEVERLLAKVRADGFALFERPGMKELTLAVPVRTADGRLLAAIALRFILTALTPDAAIARYLPQLRATAEQIAAEVSAG